MNKIERRINEVLCNSRLKTYDFDNNPDIIVNEVTKSLAKLFGELAEKIILTKIKNVKTNCNTCVNKYLCRGEIDKIFCSKSVLNFKQELERGLK